MLAVDQARLEAFVGRMVGDLGAAMSASLMVVGDELGLYKSLAEGGPATSADLARQTGTAERYVREWLSAQAASGYVEYDPVAGTFHMSPEQVAVFADESSPAYLAPASHVVAAMMRDEPKIASAFRTGDGVGWDEHDDCLFCGTARFFRTGYHHHLVQEWLPALDDVVEKLERGATVADIGCGHGYSTLHMAEAFPRSRFHGFDSHQASIDDARKVATEAGLADRVSFDVLDASETPAWGFDLACFFDCLHDMGDPVGVLRHVRETLAPGGTCLLVEPFANDRLEDNLTPIGRLYYSTSTMLCTPASLAQDGGLALGGQAGEQRLRAVAEEAGFSHFRRATETPFNLILEVRP